jgi:hypothetical protein
LETLSLFFRVCLFIVISGEKHGFSIFVNTALDSCIAVFILLSKPMANESTLRLCVTELPSNQDRFSIPFKRLSNIPILDLTPAKQMYR